jgi:NAD(P)-dependent dehydrogenase (short-subunit alcohol dehydrogenase family)
MTAKTILVTGASRGIGLAIAQELARQGHAVILTARDSVQNAPLVEELRRQTGNPDLHWIPGDLSSLAGCQTLVGRVRQEVPRLDVLINNAGVWMNRRQLTPDGLEQTFMVNHVAPFFLTMQLLPLLQAGPAARIVNVNAGLYALGRFDPVCTPTGQDFHPIRTYATSKLANVCFTQELARRLEGTDVCVNAVHPGVIRTELGNRPGITGLLLQLVKACWQLPRAGAGGPVWLAVSQEAQGVNGRYFNGIKPVPLAPIAQDVTLCQSVWRQTEGLIAQHAKTREFL